jgi:uncharacterized protein YbjT (DUF2867 family)
VTILIAGGSGTLGKRVVHLLTARGLAVRILARDPERLRRLQGDVRDPRAVECAAAGARVVISAIQGFTGSGGGSPSTVDGEGNSNLIRAAKAAGAEHFILLSVQGAAPDHPLDLFQMKARAERELLASGLQWTILRPTSLMETWADLIGVPLIKTGKARLFGRGENPINFVAADDVARFVALAVVEPAMRGETVEIGGPVNLTMRQFVQTFEQVTGKPGKVSRVPLPLMRVMAVVLRPVNPTIARLIRAGVVIDTADMTFDPAATQRRYPAIAPTRLAEVVRRDYRGYADAGLQSQGAH